MKTVHDEPLTATRQEALKSLIDDPSPVVRAGLLKELSRLGSQGRHFLESLASTHNRMMAHYARRLLEELKFSNPTEDFRSFIRSMNYELETGMILMCRVAYPSLQPEFICQEIDRIANRCRELLIYPSSPRKRCMVINRVLFHELGYRGNSEDYGNPENSFLNRVFETKKGLPLTLSVLYILVGQRLGADLDPIAYPGHFLVGSFEDDLPFYIDAFERGRFRSPEDLLEDSGGFLPLSQLSNLAPAPIHEVICRCCRNLTNHFANRNQKDMSQLFASFVQEFADCQQKHAH